MHAAYMCVCAAQQEMRVNQSQQSGPLESQQKQQKKYQKAASELFLCLLPDLQLFSDLPGFFPSLAACLCVNSKPASAASLLGTLPVRRRPPLTQIIPTKPDLHLETREVIF